MNKNLFGINTDELANNPLFEDNESFIYVKFLRYKIHKQFINNYDKLYFVYSKKNETVDILTEVGWEYNFFPIYDLITFIQSGELIKWEEEVKMSLFKNFVITEVDLGEVNDVVLKATVKELESEFRAKGFKVYKDGREMVLIKEGTPLNINGDAFRDTLKNAIIGATLGELESNALISGLITNLGILDKMTCLAPDEKSGKLFT